jgi:NAD(P)-dependent dehydrogenase (short-subunit alcohol dehydrogenase family)
MSYLDALFSLNGKGALVTGSNRGIGNSLARGLALAGASVVLNGRDRERTETAARNLKDQGLAASTSIVGVIDREAVHPGSEPNRRAIWRDRGPREQRGNPASRAFCRISGREI